MEIQVLCHERDQLIEKAMSLLESSLVPKAHPEWTTIIWQHCKVGGDMRGKNSWDSKAMGDTCVIEPVSMHILNK